MVYKTEKEQRLLAKSKQFDSAFSSKDASKLDDLLSSNYILRKDNVGLRKDLNGPEEAKKWVSAYYDKYNYEHEAIAGAVDENDNIAFSFWLDTDVKPKDEKFDEDMPDWAKKSCSTVGIWHHIFDSDEKISETYYLRQLSSDELYRKMKSPPDQGKVSFDPTKYKGSDREQSNENAQQHEAAAQIFNDIWKTGDPSPADKILDENVHEWDPVTGNETNGREAFKKMISKYAENWNVKENKSHIAVSAGDKAFIWWTSKGAAKSSGTEEQLYGLNMLTFNDAGKVSDIIGFRQPTGPELKNMLKGE